MFKKYPAFNVLNLVLLTTAICHVYRCAAQSDGNEMVDDIKRTFEDMLDDREDTEVSRTVLSDVMEMLRHPVASKTIEGVLRSMVRTMKHATGHDSLIAFSDSLSEIFISDEASPAITKFIAGLEIVGTKEKTPAVVHVLGDIAVNLIAVPRVKESIKAIGKGAVGIIDEPDSPEAIRQGFRNMKRLVTEKMGTKIVKNAKSLFSSSSSRSH